jgi:hypothetical protein
MVLADGFDDGKEKPWGWWLGCWVTNFRYARNVTEELLKRFEEEEG